MAEKNPVLTRTDTIVIVISESVGVIKSVDAEHVTIVEPPPPTHIDRTISSIVVVVAVVGGKFHPVVRPGRIRPDN